MRRLPLPFLLAIFSAGAADAPAYVPGRLLVGLGPGTEPAVLERVLRLHGAALARSLPEIGARVLAVPEEWSETIAGALLGSGLVAYVERDYYAHTAGTPNDPSFPAEWHLARIQAARAWNVTTGLASMAVAVIDSGVDASHPDLASKLVPGWNFLDSSADTGDVVGHGTAVAGTVAAATDNGIGVAGVAWASPILPLVVVDRNGNAAYSDIAAAIRYAADRGVRAINVSLGGPSSSATLQSAVDYAWNKGAVVFAAAMNDSGTAPRYPAACNHAVAVSAIDGTDGLAGFSNSGNWIALSAPGTNILTTSLGGGYGYWAGTSFAAPIVAGVAALALAANPSLGAAALVSLLEKTADDLGVPGYDDSFGWGCVNAFRAAATAVAPAAFTPIRVNAGAPVSTDALGQTWSADTGFSGGFAWSVVDGIARTATPALYRTGRTGSSFGYRFAVPDGTYTVNLKFADPACFASGLRRFNVALDGAPVLADFDIVAAAGGGLAAVDQAFQVTVTGGGLDVRFTAGAADWPIVSAIEILPGGSPPAASPARSGRPSQGTSAATRYGRERSQFR